MLNRQELETQAFHACKGDEESLVQLEVSIHELSDSQLITIIDGELVNKQIGKLRVQQIIEATDSFQTNDNLKAVANYCIAQGFPFTEREYNLAKRAALDYLIETGKRHHG